MKFYTILFCTLVFFTAYALCESDSSEAKDEDKEKEVAADEEQDQEQEKEQEEDGEVEEEEEEVDEDEKRAEPHDSLILKRISKLIHIYQKSLQSFNAGEENAIDFEGDEEEGESQLLFPTKVADWDQEDILEMIKNVVNIYKASYKDFQDSDNITEKIREIAEKWIEKVHNWKRSYDEL